MDAHDCLLRVDHLSASAPRLRSTAHSPGLSQCALTRRGARTQALPTRPYPKGRDHLRSRSRRSDPARVELPDGDRIPLTWAVASLRVRTRWEGLGGSAPSGKDALGEREWMLVDGMREVGTSLDGGSGQCASLGFGRWPSPQAITSGRPGLVRGFRTDTRWVLRRGSRMVSLASTSSWSKAPDPVRGACLLLPGVRASARTPATHTGLNHSPSPQVRPTWSPIV